MGRIQPVAPLAYIPSPSSGVVDLGPFHLHAYGITLLVAIAACIWLTGVRWVRMGGDWDLVLRTAVWGVAAGIVGARAYHDITSWNEVPHHWWGPFAVWQGGLGVWGGILLGVLVGCWIVRRSGASARLMLDAAAPGLLLAQGIGRIGNYWNQELFGKPTTLPWGLKIDFPHRPTGYLDDETFHPTFLYELIYDVVGVGLLLLVGRLFRLGPAPLAPRPERRLAPQDPVDLADALRALAAEPPALSLAHMELRLPPGSLFLRRFRALLRRRRRFEFDGEVGGMSRIEQAVAFLALLELRRSGEVALSQAAPFAPIRVARAEEGRELWSARSA